MVKILIVKTSALGDIVHLFKTVQFIKKISPDCQIDWVVEQGGASLVKAHPMVNAPIILNTKDWRKNFALKEAFKFIKNLRKTPYDVVLDFQGNTKSGLITLFSKAKLKVGFGKKSVSEKLNLLCTHLHFDPEFGLNARDEYLALVEGWSKQKAPPLPNTFLNLTPEEKQKLTTLKSKKAVSRNIMVCPGSMWPNKQMTQETMQELLKRIDNNISCKFWLVYGSPQEKLICEFIQQALKEAEVCEKLSLPLLQHWMGEMDHVIAMDSLPLHLAAEAGRPTFSVFGASAAKKFAPAGKLHVAYQGSCPFGKTFVRRCDILRTCESGACIHNLSPDVLFHHYTRFLENLPCKA